VNIRFTPPRDWDRERDGECFDLPVQRLEDGECVSLWKPTAAERHLIANGGVIRLGVVGGQPPVSVSVVEAKELPPISAEREEG
jgi:hypothetical protein